MNMDNETPQQIQTEADVILAQEQANTEQLTHEQRLEQVEQLWSDPNIHSFSLRRHSNYERDPSTGMRGALNREGIDDARVAANTWHTNLPEGASVSIFQSPSYQMAKEVTDQETGEAREVRPMRATITASLYEKELFGDQKLDRRTTDPRLGDFFETATSGEGVATFFKAVGEHYGKLTPKFWKDYVERKLHSDVRESLLNAGGKDSVGLAGNVTAWLEDTTAQQSNEESAGQKEVGLAVTHGETIYSFLHHASHYLEQSGLADPETVAAFRDFDPGYNEGMDVHVAADEVTVVVANKHVAAFKLPEFKKYLESIKDATDQ
jgi:broad specificity phosphatase PhoE